MPPPRHRRHRRQWKTLRRYAFIGLLILVLLPALPWLVVALFVDVDTVRAQVETAVQQATGRTLSLGKVTMLRSLPPTIAAEEATFANAPGGSRPDMLRIPYAEATLGMLPLLFGRLEIDSLVLSRPDLVLETDPAGTGNWQFARRPSDLLRGRARPSPRPRWARRHAAQARAVVTLELLRIREGRIAWRDDAGEWTTVEVRRLDASAPGMEGRSALSAQIGHANRTVNITLNTGRLARLRDAAPIAPWSISLGLDTPGAHASIVGTLTRPRELRGYALTVEGSVDKLDDLQGLLHRRLPPVRKLVFKTSLTDSGGPMPIVSGISLRARESDLAAWVPGLSIADLDLAAASFDSPVHAEFDGTFDRRPLHLAAESGPPAALLTPGRLPGRFPLDVNLEVAGGSLSVKGAIAAPEHGTGMDVDIAGRMPDLSALSPLIGYRLPAFRNITLGLHAGDAEGGFRRGVALRDVVLSSSEADLAGEMDVRFAERPAFRVVLNGRTLDIDALRAAIGEIEAPSREPAPTETADGWVIPSDRLPFGSLARNDLDLHASVADLRLGGTQFHNASLVVRLRDGQLLVDPLSADLAGGGVELKGALNVRGRFPPALLSVRAAGVAARPVFAALGLPGEVAGTMNLIADLGSAGASWHELAAGLSGQIGFSMVDAELDNRLLETLFGPALRAARLSLPSVGVSVPVRCVALRVDAKDGLAGLHNFVLDTPSLLLQGEGALQLRDERVALRLIPTPRGGGQPAPAVRIGGVFARTTIYPEQVAPAPAVRADTLPPVPVCADALAIARAALPRPRPP
jgi:AsmA protein